MRTLFMIAVSVVAVLYAVFLPGCGSSTSTAPHSVTNLDDGSSSTVPAPQSLSDTLNADFGGTGAQAYLLTADTLVMKTSDGITTYFRRAQGDQGSGLTGTWEAYQQVAGSTIFSISPVDSAYYNLVIEEAAEGLRITVDTRGNPSYAVKTTLRIVGTWYGKEVYGDDTYEYWYTFSEDGSYEEITIDYYDPDYGPDTSAYEGTYTLEGNRLALIEDGWYDTTFYDVSITGSAMTCSQPDTLVRAPGTSGSGIVGEWMMPVPEEYQLICDTMSGQEIDPDLAEECAWMQVRYVFLANGTLEWRIPPELQDESFEMPAANWSVSGDRLAVSQTCTQEQALEGMCRSGETIRDTVRFTVDNDYLVFFYDMNLTKTTTKPDVPAEYYYKKRSLPAARGRPRPRLLGRSCSRTGR